MKNITMMIGIPGVGKSTWVTENLGTAVLISPDRYLLERYDYEWTPERASEAWAWSYQQYAKALQSHVDIIWDATFLRRIDRSAVLNIALGFEYCCRAVYVQAPLRICLERNRKRERKPVPEETIRRMFCTIQAPDKEEGFHEIQVIRTAPLSGR